MVTLPLTGLWSQTDTLQMDVTFVGNRQMEVKRRRQIEFLANITPVVCVQAHFELRIAFSTHAICPANDTRGGHTPAG